MAYIRNFQHSEGYSPTMQALDDELGITKVTVFEHVEDLIAKNWLRRSPHKARSLEITRYARFPRDRPSCIPFVGRIAAGAPIEAIENLETIDLDELLIGPNDRFILEVQGDSMIDEQIRDGDYVVAEKRSRIRNGVLWTLACVGGVVQLGLLTASWSRVIESRTYTDYSFLFALDASPIVNSMRVVMAGHIDTWLWKLGVGWPGQPANPVVAC